MVELNTETLLGAWHCVYVGLDQTDALIDQLDDDESFETHMELPERRRATGTADDGTTLELQPRGQFQMRSASGEVRSDGTWSIRDGALSLDRWAHANDGHEGLAYADYQDSEDQIVIGFQLNDDAHDGRYDVLTLTFGRNPLPAEEAEPKGLIDGLRGVADEDALDRYISDVLMCDPTAGRQLLDAWVRGEIGDEEDRNYALEAEALAAVALDGCTLDHLEYFVEKSADETVIIQAIVDHLPPRAEEIRLQQKLPLEVIEGFAMNRCAKSARPEAFFARPLLSGPKLDEACRRHLRETQGFTGFGVVARVFLEASPELARVLLRYWGPGVIARPLELARRYGMERTLLGTAVDALRESSGAAPRARNLAVWRSAIAISVVLSAGLGETAPDVPDDAWAIEYRTGEVMRGSLTQEERQEVRASLHVLTGASAAKVSQSLWLSKTKKQKKR